MYYRMANSKKGLRDLDLSEVIETSEIDFSNDFYNPALSVAVEYKRGVGYFTSNWFKFAARGMKGLAENGGTAKWIISPILEEEDWETLQKGWQATRSQELYDRLSNLVSDLELGLQEDTRNTIAWMIADGLLEIKIAITEESLGGDFHDKWGVIKDHKGDKIAFHGSQNDSQKGFANYESYTVFISWDSEREAKKLEIHENRFDAIWRNRKRGVHSISLPDSIALEIAQLRTRERPYQNPPESMKLASAYRWRHQEEAVSKFINQKNGILHMATGTGKTRTSLKILNRLLMENAVENVVVSTYGNDLLNQWYETLIHEFDHNDMLVYRDFGGERQLGSFLHRNPDQLEALIISYDNLSEALEGDVSSKFNRSLIICDEVHNMGSPTRRENLSGGLRAFPYRLGLSATPFDPYDEDRNEFLKNEVGPVIYEFDLEDAIRRGILCELEYTPLFYELSEEDKDKQKSAFARFRAMKEENPSVPQSQLYIMLSSVRKQSEEKLPPFRKQLKKDDSILENCLIFVQTKKYGKKVQEIIHEYTKDYRTYYGEDDEINLKEFSEEKISTLVTSKAISEGIDIQSVRNIILFTSDRSKGTTIQRIGRALRTDPDNPGKKANIVDFVVGSDVKDEIEDDSEIVPPDRERYEWLKELENVDVEVT